MREIILASNSPRRRELLGRVVGNFTAISPCAEENIPSSMQPCEAVMNLAKIKAYSIENDNGGIIIGADTVVVFDDGILGKPQSQDDAKQMLKMLSGNVHKVYTGVCVLDRKNDVELCDYECTVVFFDDISDADISWYIGQDEYKDKAGAYAIQGIAARFIKGINGCYYNVVGLPINKLTKMLKNVDIGG
jgi:septum formation protein